MPTLSIQQRSKLERVVIEARDVAEAGARAALKALAVHNHEPYGHMEPKQREIRNHLRARARQLGDKQESSGRLTIEHVTIECAYEHWHRMLFARFLAENNLLINPEMGVAMSLQEAEELAKDEGTDVWGFVSRCAQRMLPQIFRPEDPLLKISFATEHMVKLEQLLDSLPPAIFTASDALGWVYQFWQSKRKDEVNRSEVKIGADEISAVTQLFTEPYMVEFLLQNTLGAWWASKQLSEADAREAKSEGELRRKLALPGVDWEYLRFVRGEDGTGGLWRQASGTFDGWPKQAKDIKILDPCCGSGHFLVAALRYLVPIRMAEENLSSVDAVNAVLRDNLYGLEIDERCCQIAAFALAFAAWAFKDTGGYRELSDLHIACTGIGPQATKAQWLELAEIAASKGRMPLKRDLFGKEDSLLSSTVANALEVLYDLFAQAPTLGSLIAPRRISKNLYQEDYESMTPLLSEVFKAETDDETRERAISAAGMVKAADLLAREYTLVITNVPYLGRIKQNDLLRAYLERHYKDGSADLATAFILRCVELCAESGITALVTPQNWMFLSTYKRLRKRVMTRHGLALACELGAGAFSTPLYDFSFALVAIRRKGVDGWLNYSAIVASGDRDPLAKQSMLMDEDVTIIDYKRIIGDADTRILTKNIRDDIGQLNTTAESNTGLQTGDNDRYSFFFWELPRLCNGWELFQRTASRTQHFAGCTQILRWEQGNGAMTASPGCTVRGLACCGKPGVLVHRMGSLPATIYQQGLFDQNGAVLIPKKDDDIPALWCLVASPEYRESVRALDNKVGVTPATLAKVPFDLSYWQEVAERKYPNGLPDPESNDPTQWLFHGLPQETQEGGELQVAVIRLLGYRWPAELDADIRLSKRARELLVKCEGLAKFTDKDGIVCIPAVRGEDPAAERLLRLLSACGVEPRVNLDEWLRNDFFKEHCEVFGHRPFVWHIWDGRKRDGFHALVNYHKLCEGGGKGRKLLESLAYSYLGDWINRCRDEVKRGEGGAEDRLAAAASLQDQLKAIIAGEPPYDIFARWKPLESQPIGWEPDINDGVRVNIRPFLVSDLPNGRKGAGILRHKPNIKWTKDRGKEAECLKTSYPWFWGWDEETVDFAGGKNFDGNRWNACHYTAKAKQAARNAAKAG